MPRVNMIPVSGSCAGSDLLIAAHAAFLAELQIKGCMDRSNRLVDGFLLGCHLSSVRLFTLLVELRKWSVSAVQRPRYMQQFLQFVIQSWFQCAWDSVRWAVRSRPRCTSITMQPGRSYSDKAWDESHIFQSSYFGFKLMYVMGWFFSKALSQQRTFVMLGHSV